MQTARSLQNRHELSREAKRRKLEDEQLLARAPREAALASIASGGWNHLTPTSSLSRRRRTALHWLLCLQRGAERAAETAFPTQRQTLLACLHAERTVVAAAVVRFSLLPGQACFTPTFRLPRTNFSPGRDRSWAHRADLVEERLAKALGAEGEGQVEEAEEKAQRGARNLLDRAQQQAFGVDALGCRALPPSSSDDGVGAADPAAERERWAARDAAIDVLLEGEWEGFFWQLRGVDMEDGFGHEPSILHPALSHENSLHAHCCGEMSSSPASQRCEQSPNPTLRFTAWQAWRGPSEQPGAAEEEDGGRDADVSGMAGRGGAVVAEMVSERLLNARFVAMPDGRPRDYADSLRPHLWETVNRWEERRVEATEAHMATLSPAFRARVADAKAAAAECAGHALAPGTDRSMRAAGLDWTDWGGFGFPGCDGYYMGDDPDALTTNCWGPRPFTTIELGLTVLDSACGRACGTSAARVRVASLSLGRPRPRPPKRPGVATVSHPSLHSRQSHPL